MYGGKPFIEKTTTVLLLCYSIFYYMMKKLYVDKITTMRLKTHLLSRHVESFRQEIVSLSDLKTTIH